MEAEAFDEFLKSLFIFVNWFGFIDFDFSASLEPGSEEDEGEGEGDDNGSDDAADAEVGFIEPVVLIKFIIFSKI